MEVKYWNNCFVLSRIGNIEPSERWNTNMLRSYNFNELFLQNPADGLKHLYRFYAHMITNNEFNMQMSITSEIDLLNADGTTVEVKLIQPKEEHYVLNPKFAFTTAIQCYFGRDNTNPSNPANKDLIVGAHKKGILMSIKEYTTADLKTAYQGIYDLEYALQQFNSKIINIITKFTSEYQPELREKLMIEKAENSNELKFYWG
jgi:hypothetical protein